MTKSTKKQLPPEAFDRIPRITLTLTDETIWLTRHDGRGAPVSTYPVAHGDVARAFSTFSSSTGLLPPETLFWGERNGQARIGIWLPPARRQIRYASGRKVAKLDIPLPGFVFVGEGTSYYIWAAAQRPTSPNEWVKLAPLPNVYTDGSICQGTVKFPACKPDTIAEATRLFFESEFNQDLSSGKVNASGSLFNFLHGLRKARRFPTGKLLDAQTMGGIVAGEAAPYIARPPMRTVTDTPDENDDDENWDPAVWMGDADPEDLDEGEM